MQTFLPYEDFKKSAEALDDKRLGKQRSESIIILVLWHLPEHYRQYWPSLRDDLPYVWPKPCLEDT
jgi:hypothetical protein